MGEGTVRGEEEVKCPRAWTSKCERLFRFFARRSLFPSERTSHLAIASHTVCPGPSGGDVAEEWR